MFFTVNLCTGADSVQGVGINLFVRFDLTMMYESLTNSQSADTVIIFDPDFNPHQDLQVFHKFLLPSSIVLSVLGHLSRISLWPAENMSCIQAHGQRFSGG